MKKGQKIVEKKVIATEISPFKSLPEASLQHWRIYTVVCSVEDYMHFTKHIFYFSSMFLQKKCRTSRDNFFGL
jgi:hypothetical protein